jgi:DNA polymerase-1
VSESAFMCKPGGRTGDNPEVLGVQEILDQWGIERVEQVIDILGLMGDSSDNVPGVPGIGPKTAQKLIAKYDSVENLLDNVEDLKGKQKENLITFREQALLSKELVTINREVPVGISLDDLEVVDRDDDELKKLFIELEFNTLGKRVFGDAFVADPQQALNFGGEAEVAELKTIGDVEHEYILVDTPEKEHALLDELKSAGVFCFDTETTGLNAKTCKLIGLAFSVKPHAGYYVPVPDDPSGAEELLEKFRGVLEDPGLSKIGHNIKFDYSVLLWHGITLKGKLFDTMLAASLIVPDMRRTMDYLSQALLGYTPIKISSLIGEKGKEQKSLRDVDIQKVAEYATEDADVTLQLAKYFEPRIAEMGQTRVFEEVECPLVPVLSHMEYEGVRMDVEVIKALSDDLKSEIINTRDTIFALAGEEFNLNSPKQLGEMLFDKLKLDPNARRTSKSKQYQTSENVLQRLAHKHEIVKEIMDYRIYTKLKSTYVDSLPNSVFAPTGRVHTHYEQAVTATGRMQSHGPNLQNIPIRTEKGRQIRKAFVPKNEDYLLLSADYSQIELRVVAELSKDDGMMQTFKDGGDIHNATAMRIYGLEEEEVTDEMRRRAKTVNFGIIYGISPFGLAERLDIPRWQASELIEQYFEQFPGAKNYMDETVEFAKENGYVETITGRRRYLRDINSRNTTTRKGAERNAINSRIQGTAADMIKIAMHKIHHEMEMRQLKSRMLMQVHDELVFDMHREEADELMPVVEKQMATAIPMEVPIVVDMGVGEHWLEAH